MAENKYIKITSNTKNLAFVRHFIEENAKNAGISNDMINQIVLSVDEACTNVIKHTHKYDESQEIEIENKNSTDKFVVILKYKGSEFDPNNKELPNMNDYFKKYKVGGLGIPLMKKFMDEIEYKHINPDTNVLVLVKNYKVLP